MARAAVMPRASSAPYCAWCADHDHARCTDYGIPKGEPCSCAEAGHEPSEVTDLAAAAMRLYCRPDLLGGSTQNLADEWRRAANRRRT